MIDSLNLALYSDQIIAANARIDLKLLALIESRGEGRRIGYIPSAPDPSNRFVDDRKRYYAQYGLGLAVVHDLDTSHDEDDLAALLACDAIHLSGGHTAGFLARLRKSAMVDVLRRHAETGGVLIGASAGAILMTPTIATDALFSGGRPEAVLDGEALGLLPFEFFPHLDAKPVYHQELLRYSTLTPRPILAVKDGDGILVRSGSAECIGGALLIAKGEARPIERLDLKTMVAA